MICSSCPTELPYSKKPNKTGLCNSCYKKMAYKRWLQNNSRIEYRKQYTLKHRKRLTLNKNEKYANDPIFKLKEVLRTRLAKALTRNQKVGSAVKELGCSIEEFKVYLESKFEPWMNWSNYGKYDKAYETWQIDHVKPLTAFNLSNSEEIKIACHYTNLQPMLSKNNITKRDKYVKL